MYTDTKQKIFKHSIIITIAYSLQSQSKIYINLLFHKFSVILTFLPGYVMTIYLQNLYQLQPLMFYLDNIRNGQTGGRHKEDKSLMNLFFITHLTDALMNKNNKEIDFNFFCNFCCKKKIDHRRIKSINWTLITR